MLAVISEQPPESHVVSPDCISRRALNCLTRHLPYCTQMQPSSGIASQMCSASEDIRQSLPPSQCCCEHARPRGRCHYVRDAYMTTVWQFPGTHASSDASRQCSLVGSRRCCRRCRFVASESVASHCRVASSQSLFSAILLSSHSS